MWRTWFFFPHWLLRNERGIPNEHFCSSHRLCWSHLKDIWHVNCIHHVWNFRKRNHWNWVTFGPLTAHLIVTSDKQKMRFSGSLLTPPHELAGWVGRVASSKLNDCTHPPPTSWGGRGNKNHKQPTKTTEAQHDWTCPGICWFSEFGFFVEKKNFRVCLFGFERTKPRSKRLLFFLCAYNVM